MVHLEYLVDLAQKDPQVIEATEVYKGNLDHQHSLASLALQVSREKKENQLLPPEEASEELEGM